MAAVRTPGVLTGFGVVEGEVPGEGAGLLGALLILLHCPSTHDRQNLLQLLRQGGQCLWARRAVVREPGRPLSPRALGLGTDRPWWPFLRQVVTWTIRAAVGQLGTSVPLCRCMCVGEVSFSVCVRVCAHVVTVAKLRTGRGGVAGPCVPQA